MQKIVGSTLYIIARNVSSSFVSFMVACTPGQQCFVLVIDVEEELMSYPKAVEWFNVGDTVRLFSSVHRDMFIDGLCRIHTNEEDSNMVRLESVLENHRRWVPNYMLVVPALDLTRPDAPWRF